MQPDLLCISIEGLRLRALGAYGGSGEDSAFFDQCAANGHVCDAVFAETRDAASVLTECWRGLPESLRRTMLVLGDAAEIAPAAELAGIGEVALLPPEEDYTSDERLIALAEGLASWVASQGAAESPAAAWLHTSLLMESQGEDVPAELSDTEGNAPPEEEFAEEEDAEEPLELAEDVTPEVLAYRDDLEAIDHVFSKCVEHWQASRPQQPLVIVVLGMVPRYFEAMDGPTLPGREAAHAVACIVHQVGAQQGARHDFLLTPNAIAGAVESFGDGAEFAATLANQARPLVAWREGTAVSMRTEAWLYRQQSADALGELFVKPDDRFDDNDIASLRPQVAEEFARLLSDLRAGRQPDELELPELLTRRESL